MKGYLFSLLILMIGLSAMAQPFSTGNRTIAYSDPSRSNRSISVQLYYPSDLGGTNAPIASGNQQFPVVVFGHGFVIPVTSYTWLADSLVSNGYIVAMPTTEGGLIPSHEQFGRDLAFLCSRIKAEGTDPVSFLFGRVWPKAAVAGHSMGGGASTLAATYSTDIQAIFHFAAAETNPSAINAASSIQIPALIFSGGNDCIVNPSVQQNIYTPINTPCKTYLNLQGATHCQFANNNGTCVFGQITSGCNSSGISTATLFSNIQSVLLPFLDYYIKDICLRGQAYLQSLQTITGATQLSTCTGFPSCGVVPLQILDFQCRKEINRWIFSWKMAQENGTEEYVIEKNDDRLGMISIGRVAAKSNGLPENEYQWETEPVKGKQNWYRIRAVQLTGSVIFTPWLRVNGSDGIIVTGISPNPGKNYPTLSLQSNQSSRITIQVFDGTGRRVCQKLNTLLPGTTQIKISELQSLPAAVYRILLTDDHGHILDQLNWMKG